MLPCSLLAQYEETTIVTACEMVARFADLPALDDRDVMEWIGTYGPTLRRGSSRVALLDMAAAMSHLPPMERGVDGTALLAWCVIGACQTWADHVAVAPMVPTYVVDRVPATPRKRAGKKGGSIPDVRKAPRPAHAERAAMVLVRAANDILATAGEQMGRDADGGQGLRLLGGLSWMPRQRTPSLPDSPVRIDSVREDDRVPSLPVTRVSRVRHTDDHAVAWHVRIPGDMVRQDVRDDDGKVVGYVTTCEKSHRRTFTYRRGTGWRDATADRKANRAAAARARRAMIKASSTAPTGKDRRAALLAAIGAEQTWQGWTFKITAQARRGYAPTIHAQHDATGATHDGTPRQVASAVLTTA